MLARTVSITNSVYEMLRIVDSRTAAASGQ